MGKKRVVVAMSGGVDSSVAAALLLQKGFEVIGATLKVWPRELCGSEAKKSCCSLRDIEDVRKVAQRLGISHYILDCQKEFEQRVIDYFCKEYLQGRTPNPCIVCNNQIKFGLLLKKAKGLGADFVATGHHARIEYDQRRKRFLIRESVDKRKDQSYVLFGLTQEKLAHILLPVGDYTKQEVRRLARGLSLKVHDKAESQEICFVPNTRYRDFLLQRLADRIKPGPIVDKQGKALGEHRGICFYTIGQREGLRIAGKEPFYVLKINRARNEIVVGRARDLNRREFSVEDVNWVALSGLPKKPLEVLAKIRSNHRKEVARVYPRKDGKVKVKFSQPQPAITPGQAAVFYDKDIVVGGGWIAN